MSHVRVSVFKFVVAVEIRGGGKQGLLFFDESYMRRNINEGNLVEISSVFFLGALLT